MFDKGFEIMKVRSKYMTFYIPLEIVSHHQHKASKISIT